MAFRCATASAAREEGLTGTASTVRAFLLVENAGPWGEDALRDVRLPEEVKGPLQARSAAARVRTLLIRRHRAEDVRPGVRVFAAWADPVAPWMETATLAGPELLADLDLEALGAGRSPGLTPTREPVFGVCTHGRHDACCAELGRPAVAALSGAHPEHTWEISHVGGDRFAANLLVLPDGLYYGRVQGADAAALGTRHLGGHLDLDRLRGRSGLAFAAQVAEVAVRRERGETRTDAVRVTSLRRDGDDTTVVVRVDGTDHEVVVRASTSAASHQLTCRALRESAAPAWEVLRLTRV